MKAEVVIVALLRFLIEPILSEEKGLEPGLLQAMTSLIETASAKQTQTLPRAKEANPRRDQSLDAKTTNDFIPTQPSVHSAVLAGALKEAE